MGFSETFDQQSTYLILEPGTDQVIWFYYVPMHTTLECLHAFSHENYGWKSDIFLRNKHQTKPAENCLVIDRLPASKNMH